MRSEEDVALPDLAVAIGTERFATPFLAVDLPAMQRNLAEMQRRVDDMGTRLRPHVKTHKSTLIAKLQMEAGAIGITCSTTDEVKAMVAAGIADVLLANVVTDRVRLQVVAAAATRATVTVAVDSSESASLLSEAATQAGATLGVVIDCDIGMARNGVSSAEEGLRLAALVETLPGLALRGVMAYEGHLVALPDRTERRKAVIAAFEMPLALLNVLHSNGFEAPMLTGGSTSSYDVAPDLQITDIQAGTYALMDNTYTELAPEFEIAAAVVASVQTVDSGGRLVLNVGAKRLSTDWGDARLIGYDATLLYLAEEHGVFRLTGDSAPSVGDRVAVVPGHICSTMSMYNRAVGCSSGVFDHLLPIDARDPLA